MKIIIDDKIVETGFISHIEKKSSFYPGIAGMEYFSIDMIIYFVLGNQKVEINIGSTREFYPNIDNVDDEIKDIEKRCNRVLKFIEDHSNNAKWPYPKMDL